MKHSHLQSIAILSVVAATLIAGCKPSGNVSTGGGSGGSSFGPAVAIDKLPLGLDPFLRKIPDDNKLTKEKVELGRHLYFDKRLSIDDTVSCASCHAAEKGWSNGEAVATGIKGQKGGRSSPTVINRVFSDLQFWDGRAATLEEQALGPITNPIEMGMPSMEATVAKLDKIAGYKPLFTAAFGDEKINNERIAQAIASFERTIVSGNSPYDRFQNGDKTAMSESAQRGRTLFFDNNKTKCAVCHAGHNFTDEKYHNLGVGFDKDPKQHQGRGEITKNAADTGGYKTPTLRQIAETAPYMHDGSEKTLMDVVEFYAKGGVKNEHLDEEIIKLELTDQDKKDLVAFMEALSGDVTTVTAPTPVQ